MTLRRALLAMWVLSSAVVVGITGVSAQARPQAAAAPAAPGISSHESGIKFTSRTVMIPRGVVRKELIGVSASGLFKFKRAVGALARLKPGKVMLLQGSDALLVVAVSHKHGHLLVRTKAASLPQLIKKGTITFSGTPNFDKAFVGPMISSPAPKGADDLRAPGYPYVGLPPAELAHAAGGPTFSVQGSAGAFGYSLAFTPQGNSGKLDVSGTLCFQWGSICSNGPSNGLSLEVNLSGYIDIGSEAASISVNGGQVTKSTVSLNAMKSHLKITYTAARGTGADAGGDPPTFHIPVGIDYTIPGEIPIYIKLQTAIFLRLGMSSQNSVLRGGVLYDSDASDTVKQSGKTVSGTGSGTGPTGNILDDSDRGTGPTVALGAGGAVVAVQFPKIGVGLGIRALNAIGYLDMITSIGQTAAGALSIVPGCKYDLFWSEGGGVEAQLGPFGIASPRKIFYPTGGKQFSQTFNAPGC